MKRAGTSEKYQNNNLKALIVYSKFLGPSISFFEVENKNQVISFLDTKIKNSEEDPDKRWITTWNDYLVRIKYFFRWLYNCKDKDLDDVPFSEWETPDFVKIKNKKTKRIPHEAKTGTGSILLTTSFPYVRDWLNEHPFKNEPNSRLICNLINGSPITADNIDKVMKQLRERIIRLLENGEINNIEEKEKIEYLLQTKKWNPYCIRHSAITADSDYLPEYALKKKVRWSMNSRQGSRYIKRRMGDELKEQILKRNGIIQQTENKVKLCILNCPRCELVNTIESKYCSKCSYPLKPEAYEEIKSEEDKRMKILEEKQKQKDEQINIIQSQMNALVNN
jgi:integrase/recombinase XerD